MTECHTFDTDPVAEFMRNTIKPMKTYVLIMHNNFTEEDMEYKTFARSEEQAMDTAEEVFDSDWCVSSVREIKEDEYY